MNLADRGFQHVNNHLIAYYSTTIMAGRNRGRRKGASEIYTGLWAAIVMMRAFYHEKFKDIEKKIGVKASTARNIFAAVRERATSWLILKPLRPRDVS